MTSFSSFDKLLEAMDIISSTSDSKLKYDKTVQMTIVSLVDGTTGEYLVEYQSNKISAFVTDLNKTYKKGDIVFVKVPEGDFSNTKLIEGKVISSSSTIEEKNILSNAIIEITPSATGQYMYNCGDLVGGLISGPASYTTKINHDGLEKTITLSQTQTLWEIKDDVAAANTLFHQYAQDFDKIIIKASFFTPFSGVHTKGNYGIRVTTETTEDGIVKTYDLDTSSFVGNIYNFSDYSPQYTVISLPLGITTKITKIELFQENMEVDVVTNYDGSEIKVENVETPNILVKDIEVSFCQVLDYTQDVYHSFITTPLGNTFNSHNKDSALQLKGNFIYQGDNAYDESNCSVFWFKENYSITVANEKYDNRVGPGWELVQNDSDNPLLLEVAKKDVIINQKYKFLIEYGKSKITYNAEAVIYNSTSEYPDIRLEQNNAIISIVPKTIGEVELTGYWYRLLPDNSYTKKEENKTAFIDSSRDLLYQFVIYNCEVYLGEQYITNRSITVYKGGGAANEIGVAFDGIDHYQYDANGNYYYYNENGELDDSEARMDKTLKAKITWLNNNQEQAYTITWCDIDGNEISKDLSNSSSIANSMLTKLYVDSEQVLHYQIKSEFYNTYTNNSVVAKIKLSTSNTEYLFQKDILFSKTGDPGTNGTDYVVFVRPVDADRKLKTGFVSGHINSNSSIVEDYMNIQTPVYLEAYVYRNGERINTDESDYIFEYQWTTENVKLDNNPEKVATITQVNMTSSAHVVKLKVTISDGKSATNIYYNYPFSVSVGTIEDNKVELNIPTFIKYSANGVNPVYSTRYLLFKYNEIDYTNKIESYNNLLSIREINNGKRLIPTPNFIYDSGTGALKLIIDENNYIDYTVMMYLDPYGNENINGWDGTKINVDGENSTAILAPQVGAGVKDDNNTFTGMVMGKYLVNDSNSSVGLFGFNKGVQTFELSAEDGSAWFGKNKAIQIDANNSIIKGTSNNGNDTMILKLSGDSNNYAIETKGFKVKYDGSFSGASSKFQVDATGKMICTGANIGGTLQSVDGTFTGELVAPTGSIGGWVIGTNSLQGSNSENNRIYLYPNGEIDCTLLKMYTTSKLEQDDVTGKIEVLTNVSLPYGDSGALHILSGRDSTHDGLGIKIQADGIDGASGGYIYLSSNGYVKIGPTVEANVTAVFG